MKKIVDKIFVPLSKRPKCINKGCNRHAHNMGTYDRNGYPRFRKYCGPCHIGRMQVFRTEMENFDRRNAPKCKLYDCRKRVTVKGTNHKGKLTFNVYCADHVGLNVEYRAYRKDYCENIDGRLQFQCTTTIIWDGMLDVDHIDGNPENNDPKNLQTLCKCCHAYKTNIAGDYATPGRKTLKNRGFFTKLMEQ